MPPASFRLASMRKLIIIVLKMRMGIGAPLKLIQKVEMKHHQGNGAFVDQIVLTVRVIKS